MTDDHEREYIQRAPQEVSAALLHYEERERVALVGIYHEHPKQTQLPDPAGIHTRVEIRGCIYEHLAVVQ